MSKTFTYTKITGRTYCGYSDEYEYDGVEFDYEVDKDQLLDEVVNLVFDDYFSKNEDISGFVGRTVSIKEGIRKFIEDYDLLDALVDDYEDWLKEIFEDEAMEYYE